MAAVPWSRHSCTSASPYSAVPDWTIIVHALQDPTETIQHLNGAVHSVCTQPLHGQSTFVDTMCRVECKYSSNLI